MHTSQLFLAITLVSLLYVLYTIISRHKILQKHINYVTFASITNLAYILHNALLPPTKTRTEVLHAAHMQQPVLRLGPTRLSFASAAAIKDVYGTGTKTQKGDQYTTPGCTPNLLSVVDRNWHAVKRKRLSAAFATSHLVDWEHKVHEKIGWLMQAIDITAKSGQSMDFRYWSNLFTMDAIMDIALSHQSGFLRAGADTVTLKRGSDEETGVSTLDSLRAGNRATEPVVWSATAFPLVKRLCLLVPSQRKQWGLAACWQQLVHERAEERLGLETAGQRPDDLFACLVRDSKEQALNLDRGEINAEVAHFLDAGSDTTSIALTHVMYCLAKNPEKLAVLRKELDAALGGSEDDMGHDNISYAQVRGLPYLKACLDESMRLRPALSAGQQRRTPPEGMTVGGTWVEGNVMVSIPAFTAHRDPAVFTSPAVYLPERWLGEAGKQLHKYTLTFSAGGRVCIGKNITMLEQSLLVAAVVRKYDFELPSSDWKMQWEEHFNMWPKALPLVFRPRSVGGSVVWTGFQ